MSWKGRGIHGSGRHSLTGDKHGRVWRDRLIRELKQEVERLKTVLETISNPELPDGKGCSVNKNGSCLLSRIALQALQGKKGSE